MRLRCSTACCCLNDLAALAPHITYLSVHVLMPAGHNRAHTWKQLLWQSALNHVLIQASRISAIHGASGSWNIESTHQP